MLEIFCLAKLKYLKSFMCFTFRLSSVHQLKGRDQINILKPISAVGSGDVLFQSNSMLILLMFNSHKDFNVL